jgi:hypothetical protein
MSTGSKTNESDLVIQEHCIDLPGESVQCWIGGGTDKLKVILRKHRDVIFDIHFGNNETYTVQSTESDFYIPRDKKLAYAARHDKITFKDGERMHVWVSRGFRGALIVKCNTHIITEVKPNEWDRHRHSDDPKEKPAPIIVAIKSPSPISKTATPDQLAHHEALNEGEPSLHVHEVSKKGAPPSILEFFENGGESLDLDSENIITRNWIIAQLTGTGGYIADNHTWIKELIGCKFRLEKVIHKSGPKVYMIFSGNNKLRKIISASRYSLGHAKVLRIAGGASGVKQGWDATKGAAKDSLQVFAKEEGKMVAKGGGIALIFVIAIDTTEWYKDYSQIGPDGKPQKDFFDLFAKLGMELLKTGLIAGLTTASVSLFFAAAAFVGVTVAAPVILVVTGTIAVSIAIAFLVEKADKAVARSLKTEDTTTWIANKFRETAQYLSKVSHDARYEHYELTRVLPIGR